MKIQQPILVMGLISPSALNKAIKNDLSLVVFNLEMAKMVKEEAKKLGRKAKMHLKVETGTNRLGVAGQELARLARFCSQQKEISLEGIYTHYANIEDTLNPDFAQEQLKRFKRTVQSLKNEGIEIPLKHTACSAAAILFKETHFDIVRLGLGLYGLWSSRETKISAQGKSIKINLKPVLTWKTKIVQVKEVMKGETIGYGRTFTTARKTKIAVLPVGYWDGYDRRLSNQGRVLIKGKTAPVIGRVCMNMMMVEVTEIPRVKIGEEVVLLGKQGREEITAEEIAQKMGTINYEMVTRINPLLPRKLVK